MKSQGHEPDALAAAHRPVPAPIDNPQIYLAAERTFLAWIRTAIALMGFGFVIARFALFLREYRAVMTQETLPRTSFSNWLGVGMIGVGVGVSLLAAVRHRDYLSALERGIANPPLPARPALALAGVLAVVGFAIALHIFTL